MSRLVSAGFGVLALGPARAAAQNAAGLSGPPSMWHFQIGVGSTWNENARFTAEEESSWMTNARASLGFNRRFRTGSFSLSGFGGKLYYPEIPEFDQWTYGGSAGLGWAPSRRSQLTLSQTYARSNTRQLPEQDVEGLPLPTSGVDTASSGLGFSHQLGRRTQLGLDGAFTWRRYDNPALIGGEQLNGGAQLSRNVGQNSAIGLTYGLSESWAEGQEVGRVHVATLGVSRKPERGVGIELSGGAAYIERIQQYHPTGSAGLSASGRKTSFSARYFRDFGLAFGYGRQTISDRFTAGMGWTPVERLSFSLGYSYGNRHDPADEDFRVQSHVGSAGFSWRVVKGLGFAAGYSYEQNRTDGFPELKGGRATASLSYGVDWR